MKVQPQDVICFSTTDWDEIWGSRQQIMLRLAAAGQRVLFVERQVGPEQLLRDPLLLRRKLAAWQQPRLRQQAENLWLYQPSLLPPGRYYSQPLNRLGQRWLAGWLKPVLQQLKFTAPLLWCYPPQSAPLLQLIPHRLSVYHCIDYFPGNQRGLKRQVMEAQEAALLRQADLVLTHSVGLQQRYQPLTRREILLVPSAADVAHFQATAAIHPDLAALPRPRLGMMGTLDGRMDVPLLLALAQQHPEWHLALIGQIRPGRVNLEALLALPNVHHLGPRPHTELPLFLNGMDVLLIPYVLDELTRYISPLKLYEYLAVGKPIVSVPMPEVQPLAAYVEIAGRAEFAKAITRALAQDSPAQRQARRQAALEHTWDQRVRAAWAAIEGLLREGGSP